MLTRHGLRAILWFRSTTKTPGEVGGGSQNCHTPLAKLSTLRKGHPFPIPPRDRVAGLLGSLYARLYLICTNGAPVRVMNMERGGLGCTCALGLELVASA